MHSPKFNVKQRTDGQWTVVLVAANGEPLMTGEGYTRQDDAVRACDAIRRAATVAAVRVIPTPEPLIDKQPAE